MQNKREEEEKIQFFMYRLVFSEGQATAEKSVFVLGYVCVRKKMPLGYAYVH